MRAPHRIRPLSPPALDHQAHRALGSASRTHLIQTLLAEGPLQAEQLAGRVGLHLNTVRAHLEVLRKANLVSARAIARPGPGRPRLAFAATEMVPDDWRGGSYRLLARILIASLREPDGPERVTTAGREAGRELVAADRRTTPRPTDPRGGVLTLLDRLGFAPRALDPAPPGEPEVVELHGCPFSELAESDSPTVCSVHQGILEGAFAQLGGNPESLQLIPFVAPGLCAVHLHQS
ncbi:MAG: helix-turn-helix domain-containing protein [Candidatus Dormibacteraeota bacterium]|uniref:Helix-turn-helix domain-containing protein n=1 Tax=Candidatus Aeolococcus gillhamiae TaxID=3127015 RepID=A0A934N8T9_9BACT|nr:helix-turn-helix domain-containing protein [Candidatus Dormibacteraeota bacterium]